MRSMGRMFEVTGLNFNTSTNEQRSVRAQNYDIIHSPLQVDHFDWNCLNDYY